MRDRTSGFHFLRLAWGSARTDVLFCLTALLFLGSTLEALRRYAEWYAGFRGDYFNSWETFLPLYYFLFILLCGVGHLSMTLWDSHQFLQVLPIPRHQQALVRLAEPALLTFLWFVVPYSIFLSLLDPDGPHIYYLVLVWLLIRSLMAVAEGGETLRLRMGWTSWGAIAVIQALAIGLAPIGVIPLYWYKIFPEVFNEWVMRPNPIAVGGAAAAYILSAIFFWATVTWNPRPRTRLLCGASSASTQRSTPFSRLTFSSRWKAWTPFILPPLSALLFFLWTRFCFWFLSILPDFFAWLAPMTLVQFGERSDSILIVVAFLCLIPHMLVYTLIGAPLFFGALSIIPFLHHWQTLPLRPRAAISALLIFGIATALGLWLLVNFNTSGADAYDLLPSILHLGWVLTLFALPVILYANPLHWGSEPSRISDPPAILAAGISLVLMVGLLRVIDLLPTGPWMSLPLLLPIAYNLSAMVWMYRRY